MAQTGLLLVVLCAAAALAARYDNSQHGQENYILDMEDVLILAIQDPENYDTDYYDYSDLTVKPEEDLTPPSQPMSTSTQASMLQTTQANGPTNSTSQSMTEKVPPPADSTNHQHPLNTHNMQIPVVVVTDPFRKKGYISSSSIRKKNANVPNVPVESLPKRNCAPGFVLDEKNRCKKNKNLLSRHRIPLPYGLHYAQRPQQEPSQSRQSSS